MSYDLIRTTQVDDLLSLESLKNDLMEGEQVYCIDTKTLYIKDGTDIVPITSRDVFTFDTIADLQACGYLVEDDVVDLNGYYTVGDGANHKRIVSLTDDGSGVVIGSLFANLMYDGEVNVKWLGAKGDGITDDTNFIQQALDFKPAKVILPEGIFKVSMPLIKHPRVSLIGMNGIGNGAQFEPNKPKTTIEYEGIATNWLIEINPIGDQEDISEISGISFRAIGTSEDNIGCILCNAKSTIIQRNSILNFTTGIKIDDTQIWVRENQILSCGICLDISGTESHVYQNHGYPHTKAILLRGSANMIHSNKFFGDGAECPIGMEIWGRGNTIIGNVLDAFTNIGIRFYNNVGTNDPSYNTITGNTISGIGVAGQTNQTSILFDASAGDIEGNVIVGNTFFNKRLDRQSVHCVNFYGIGAFYNRNNQISNNSIEDSTFSSRSIISNGLNNINNKVESNGEYITENVGISSVVNGDIINHGLKATPSFISLTPTDNNVGSFGYDNVTFTTFRILLRDASGNLITTPTTINWKAESNYA